MKMRKSVVFLKKELKLMVLAYQNYLEELENHIERQFQAEMLLNHQKEEKYHGSV